MASYRITSSNVMAVAVVLLAVGGMCSKWDSFGHFSHVRFDLVGEAFR